MTDPAPGERTGEIVRDCAFLSALVVLSLVLYVGRLGFYGDDWSYLSWFGAAPHQSLLGRFDFLYSPTGTGNWVRIRPVQILHLAALYTLFDVRPLGYHLVNGAVFLCATLLLYLALSEIGLPRLLSLAVTAVYAMLPHYSTDRFWMAAFQANLSMALYFLSLCASLKALRAGRTWLWVWQAVGVVTLAASILAYEVVLGFAYAGLVLIWYRGHQLSSSPSAPPAPSRTPVLLAVNLAVLLPITAWKLFLGAPLGMQTGLVQHLSFILRTAVGLHYGRDDYGFNIKQAVLVNFGTYGIGLPRVAWKAAFDYADPAILIVAGVAGVIVFAHLYGVANRAGRTPPRNLLRMFLAGLLVFGLGFAVFLATVAIQFSPTGITNRTAIAAALGVALCLVALACLVGELLCPRLRPLVLALLLALVSAAGLLINNAIARFWIAAYEKQQLVLADIRRHIPTLPSHSTLILDEVCPYVGPGIVFESSWDLTGALRMLYGDMTLQADVTSARLGVGKDGITTGLAQVAWLEGPDGVRIRST
ncbi:MAG: hypothetical protein QME77_10375 [bacterium]|nr:hypothetical protein [bacterium]